MSYKFKTVISKRANYGEKRATSDIKYLVFHYTGNDGDTDEANANYFKNRVVEASAHYFVDDDSITQTVKCNYVAYAVGSQGLLDQGSPYANKGAKFFRKCTNQNSISIEMCDTRRDGKHIHTKRTLDNAYEIGKKIAKKYNIDDDHIIRHFDVNGKICPYQFVVNEKAWKEFKKGMGYSYTREEFVEDVNKILKVENAEESFQKAYTVSVNKNAKSRLVKPLQRRMKTLGYYDDDIDGIFGAMMKKAIKEYQLKGIKKSSSTCDGIVTKGSITWECLLGVHKK